MRWNQIKLYSFTAPLALLPLLDFSFNEVGDYLRGTEFRTFAAELFSQLISGVVDSFIIAGVSGFFSGF